MANKFNAKQITELQKVFNKAQYVKKEWKVDESTIMTLAEYAEYIDSTFKYVDGNPMIIAKEKKDGGIFLKMSIPLTDGSEVEYELPYEKDFGDCETLKDYPTDFEEDDEIDLNSLRFGVEKFLDKSHGFAVGKMIE